MKKVIAFLCIFSFTFSCIPDVGTDDGVGPIIEGGIELEIITGTILIPENSNINTENLKVSTFTDESQVKGNKFSVKVAQNEHNTIFVTDEFEKIVFLGYTYPGQNNHTIDASSTTLAMLMNLPFVTMLSKEAKTGFIQELTTNEEYLNLASSMSSLISNRISPLNTEQEDLINKLLSVFSNSATNKKSNDTDDPVSIMRQDNEVNFINPGKSYDVSIGVYRNNQRIEIMDLNRVLFVATSTGEAFSNLSNQIIDGFEVGQVKHTMEGDGIYDFKIRNGAKGDSSTEDDNARYRNIAKIALDIFLANPKKGSKNTECVKNLLGLLVKTAKLAPNNSVKFDSPYVIMGKSYDVLVSLVKTSNMDIPECAGLKPSYGKLLGKLYTWEKWVAFFGTSGNLTVAATQLALDKGAMDLCYEVNGGVVQECERVSLSGDLAFKRVPIGKPQTRKITLRNNGLEPFNIKEFKYPAVGFISEPLIGENGLLLENGKSKDFIITFNPETVNVYSGEFEVITDADSSSVKLAVNAKGVIALTSDKTELDFGKLLVDQSSDPQTITLKNDSDVDIVLTEVAPIEGYEFSIPEQTIPAGQPISIEVVFKPTDDFADYNKSFVFQTDTDQQDLIVELKGDGFKGLNLEVLSMPNNLDFGKVDITSETGETKSLRLSNPTDISISISGFVYTNEADGGYYTTSLDTELANAGGTIELPAGTSRDFTITFKPEILGFYNGDFVIDNTESQDAPIRVPIMGEAVLNEISINPDFLDFGEVEVGSPPETRTFTITNNLKEEASISIVPDDDEITTNWNNGTVLPIGVPRTVTVQFNPTSNTTTINGTIQIEATNLNQFAVVSYTARKKENITNILDGNWMPTWVVTTCEPTATSNDMGCINHQNTRPYVFIPTSSATCQELLCGIMDFNNIRNGNSDSAVINNWEYDGTNVTINIRSDSNGFFFLTRTFTFSGIFDQNTNTIVGQYISEYTGGGTAGWKNKATGTLTLTRE